jgi:hypothetical protein
MPLAVSTFLQAIFAAMIVVPLVILWVAAVVDVIRHQHSGLKIAAMLVLVLIFPLIGPILYFAFRKPSGTAEEKYMAEADLRRERHDRPIDTSGIYR